MRRNTPGVTELKRNSQHFLLFRIFQRAGGAFFVSAFITIAVAPGCQSWNQFWAPIIEKVEPNYGADGDTIEISGSQFSAELAENVVHFGSVAAIVSSATTSKLVVRVPNGANSGKVSVTVRNATTQSREDFSVEKYAIYAPNNSGSVFGALSSNANGSLTATTTLATGGTANDLAADSKGRYLYVTNGFGAGLFGYAINKQSGNLTALSGSPFLPPGGTETTRLTVDKKDRCVYFLDVGSALLFKYQITDASGTLFSPASIAVGNYGSLMTDSGANYLYAAQSSGIDAFLINTASGALSVLAGSPFSTVQQVNDIQFSPDEKFMFGGRQIPTDFVRLTYTSGSGSLGSMTSLASGTGVKSLAITPNGKYVYTVDDGTSNLRMYNLDASGNVGTATITVAAGSLRWVRITPNGKYLYALTTAGSLYGYIINPDGSLSGIPGGFITFAANSGGMIITRIRQ